MQGGLVREQARDDRVRAIAIDLRAAEPARPAGIEDTLHADLVDGAGRVACDHASTTSAYSMVMSLTSENAAPACGMVGALATAACALASVSQRHTAWATIRSSSAESGSSRFDQRAGGEQQLFTIGGPDQLDAGWQPVRAGHGQCQCWQAGQVDRRGELREVVLVRFG